MAHLTGKLVAENTFKDFESFFYHSAKFEIKKEFNSPGISHISFIGDGNSSRIRLSKEFCEFPVNNLDDLFFITITLCHEIAHYLNKHNDHKGKQHIDFTAIESWADFFGARVFMTVITFGKETKASISKFDANWNQDTILKSIGHAIGKVYREIYKENSDKRYQSSIDRVLIFNAGVSSFFYRMYDDTLKPTWTAHVLTTILREANLIYLAGTHNPDWNKQSLIAEKLSEIHKTIQGSEIAITTEGLKANFIPLLVTNYNLNEQEIRNRKETLIKQVTPLGIDVDDFYN